MPAFWISIIFMVAYPLQAQSGFAELADGFRLYYDIHGNGEPLVLIAGGPGDAHNYFKPYFKKAEKKCKVIYYDARGRGRSQSADSVFSLDQDVKDLYQLLLFLKLEKPNILGHSYGGLVAELFAMDYPEKTGRVVLCNTFHSAEGWQNNIDNCNRHIMESYPDQWAKLKVLRTTVKSSEMEWRLIYDPCITSLYWYDMSSYSVFLKKHLDGPSPGFSYPVYYSIIGDDPDVDVNGTMKGMDLRLRLKSLDKPVLVITGRADKVATVQQAFEIQRLIPNSQIHIFNKSGHLPFIEENALFSEILTDFLIR